MIRSGVSRRKATFVIRMWAEPTAAVGDTWRGQIEHLQSGDRRHFVALACIEAFIVDHLRKEEDEPMTG